MGGPHTVVKNPSPDKKSWSENTGLDLDLDLDMTLALTFLVCFIISLYVITYNKLKSNKNNPFCVFIASKNNTMNAYGSVSRVSESIYKLLRYMNWFSLPDDANTTEDPLHLNLEP
jgi:hypothetical protein